MLADQTAKKREHTDGTANGKSGAEPMGLRVSRKPIKQWACRPVEGTYEIVSQVGEGTFRYFLPGKLEVPCTRRGIS